MTGVNLTGASSTFPLTWDAISWRRVVAEVKRLQMRIAKAIREKRYGKAKALQWLLTRSYYAKLLAIKRVAQSTGAKTPGIDGVIWRTPRQKMRAVSLLKRRGYHPHPLRRIYIPKKNGDRRPLSIPTLHDRAMQALYLLALEPVTETLADRNAYGFRPKRCVADAIEQCFKALVQKTSASWILEGDIRSCFDTLSGEWLRNHTPMDKMLLSKWLTAGYIEHGMRYPTFNGVPQGGTISPALLVLALSGLEEAIKRVTTRNDKVNVVVYADDFIVTGASKEVLEQKVMPAAITFLAHRGLALSAEKTKITHVDEGFNFLGFNIRKYKGKLLIKPAKANVKALLAKSKALFKSHTAAKAEDLIRRLNSLLRGWSNYYRFAVAKKIFTAAEDRIYWQVARWVKRRHPQKNAQWRYNKYYRAQGLRHKIFSAPVKNKDGHQSVLDLYSIARVPIRRHIKIKGEATPYDPQFKNYFLQRERLKRILTLRQKEPQPLVTPSLNRRGIAGLHSSL